MSADRADRGAGRNADLEPSTATRNEESTDLRDAQKIADELGLDTKREPTLDDWLRILAKTERTKRRSRRALYFAILSAVLAFGLMVGGFIFLITFKDVPASQDQLKCVALLQADFMGDVGDFANSKPAPNTDRTRIQRSIKDTSKKLHRVALGTGSC